MKSIITLVLFSTFCNAFAQPNPRTLYPYKIMSLDSQIIVSPNNYTLRWNRVSMKIDLIRGSFSRWEAPFANHEQDAIDCNTLNCEEIELDLKLCYAHGYTGGDFYLKRMIYYDKSKQYEKALKDALYIRDSLPKPKTLDARVYEYHRNYAFRAIPGLYILNKNYSEALNVLNSYINDEIKNDKWGFYLHGTNLTSNLRMKLDLYYYKDQRDSLITLLKDIFQKHFELYFKEKSELENKYWDPSITPNIKDQIVNSQIENLKRVKQNGYYFLSELVKRMKEFESEGLSEFEKLQSKLKNPNKKSFYDSDINLELSDAQLREILSIK